MKLFVYQTVNIPQRRIEFQDLKAGDLFLSGNEFDDVYLKITPETTSPKINAVSLKLGRCTHFENYAPVKVFRSELTFEECQFITTKEKSD